MSNVIQFFKDTALPVSTMVQLGLLMVLFTGLGLLLFVCGIKAVLRSKKVGVGMPSSIVILVVGLLGLAAGGWVDYTCVQYGIQEDADIKAYNEAMQQYLDEDGTTTFTVGEDGQVVSDGGIVIESEAEPEDADDGASDGADYDSDGESDADSSGDEAGETDPEGDAEPDGDAKSEE